MKDTENKGNQSPGPFSFLSRARSFKYALAGGRVLLAGQPNARIHTAATVLVVIAGLSFGLTRPEWTQLLFAMALVWSLEAVNTSIELLADEVTQEQCQRIGQAKDVAAFSVLVAALVAVLIGCMIFIPHIWVA